MATTPLRFCVVGSGPGGMYTCKYLLRELGERVARVDVVEKLPTAYGLVRYGVAPDHPEVKSVSNDFDDVMKDPRVRFLGNVDVGHGAVSVEKLQELYDGVVLSYGASADRVLGLPHEEETTNVWGARAFVNWYNGHPDAEHWAAPLLDCDTAVVVGQGNVALDCARVLCKSVDELAKTDISPAALEALSHSRVRRVVVAGRRGSAQAAFTIKELRELTKLDGVGCALDPDELARGLTPASLEEVGATRAKKRINDLIQKIAVDAAQARTQERVVDLRFLLSPVEIHQASDGRISGVSFQPNELVGEADAQQARPVDGAAPERIDCGLLVRSIGYKSEPLPGVPFDPRASVVQNQGGRVPGVAGLYTSGWLKRGPTGIIGTNITDARETVDCMVQDVETGVVQSKGTGSDEAVDAALSQAGVEPVTWEQYKALDEAELQDGAKHGSTRRKRITIDEMMQTIHQSTHA